MSKNAGGGFIKRGPSPKRGCAYWLKLLLVGAVGGLVIYDAASTVLAVNEIAHPPRAPVCCMTPADFGLGYEQVSLATSDGVLLSGWYIPSQNEAAVILLHGFGAHRAMMLNHAAILAKHGYGVLMYDLRAHGESGGEHATVGWLDVKDVAVAMDFLGNRSDVDRERIGILGFSVGGQIAIRAAAEMEEIRAVVGEEPAYATVGDLPELTSLYERWVGLHLRLGQAMLEWHTGVSAPRAVVEVIGDIAPRPILLISSGEDMGDSLARHFYDLAGEPKTFWQVPEATHGGVIYARPQEYEQRVVTFFDEALLGNGPAIE